MLGRAVGRRDGLSVGRPRDGRSDGLVVGFRVGRTDGLRVGRVVTREDGLSVGRPRDGRGDGWTIGWRDGRDDGFRVGRAEGLTVGLGVRQVERPHVEATCSIQGRSQLTVEQNESVELISPTHQLQLGASASPIEHRE